MSCRIYVHVLLYARVILYVDVILHVMLEREATRREARGKSLAAAPGVSLFAARHCGSHAALLAWLSVRGGKWVRQRGPCRTLKKMELAILASAHEVARAGSAGVHFNVRQGRNNP